MELQKNRQEMFEEIQKLRRELAEGAWDYVNLAENLRNKDSTLTNIKEFICGHGLESTVGMALGSDRGNYDADKVINEIRKEFANLIVQSERKE